MRKSTKCVRRRPLRIELLEERQLLAGNTYLVNFQNDEATTPTHYLRDTGELFGARGNGLSYGWSSDHTDQARERSADPDQRLDTLIHFEANQYWEFALDNGLYEVTVAVGDPGTNDGIHTINVEGVNYWNAVPDTADAMIQTQQVTVSDGRLTIDQGTAANKATRINFVHIVGLANGPNASPLPPTITEPSLDGQIVNPSDVHMEAIGYSDPDADAHKSTDWEIWTVGPGAEPVWQTLGIDGVERLHTHLGDGVFINALAGEIELAENTDYELRVRYRDDVGSVSAYATRLFHTTAASVTSPLTLQDVSTNPAPTWLNLFGAPIDLPTGVGILAPGDTIVAIDVDPPVSNSSYPPGESPAKAIDGTLDKYLNFGEGGSGFIVTPGGSTTVRSFRLTTANDEASRDPASFELWGTNDAVVSADNSDGLAENWTFIDGFDLTGTYQLPTARNTPGPVVPITNSTAYTSYKVIFPTVRNAGTANSMQIAEVSFYQTNNGTGGDILGPGDPILAIHAATGSASPPTEGPANAIDQNLGTKYLNFGRENSGFIVTPSVGPTEVSGFQITTANDSPSRDPASWALYGTNDPVSSPQHSQGSSENWVLIDSGAINLPLERLTAGAIVAVNNAAGSFTSYRVVFPTVRDPGAGDADSMQIAEFQFFGEENGAANPPSLRLEDGATGDRLLLIEGSTQPGNLLTDYPPLAASHANVRVVIEAGSSDLVLNQSDLVVADAVGTSHTIFLPAISLAAGQRLDLWVSAAGGTYYGNASQTEPDFSSLARQPTLDIPFVATQPGFVVEQVGSGYRLPVNIAFVPNPGPNPDDPLYYVTELYGSIQVVTRDGTKHEFATALLDYNPQGPISGSGEQGLTGIAVQRDELNPEIYHLYVGMLWDNGSPAGGASHYPKVERIDSLPGGLAMDSRALLLNMQPETQGQSHQISNITIGPDGKLYVHNGDGFNASTAQNLNLYRGKILRMNLDGTAPSDNPYYDISDGINARDFIYAYGLRNPFGGAWRAADGRHYEVENGPSVDRLARVDAGVNYGWDGSDGSMFTNALYNWTSAHAPVNIAFVQPQTFHGSQFPASMMDHAFVSESGPTYASGPQANGKQIVYFHLNAAGTAVLDGPTTLVQYVGTGRSTVVGLAAGPDGLYFTELYEDSGTNGPTGAGARIYRVRYVNSLPGDYDINGIVDGDDYLAWRSTYGSTLLLAPDGSGNGVVDAADYVIWRKNLGSGLGSSAGKSSVSEVFDTALYHAPTAVEPELESTASNASVMADLIAVSPVWDVAANGPRARSLDSLRPMLSREHNSLAAGFVPSNSHSFSSGDQSTTVRYLRAAATDRTFQGWGQDDIDDLLVDPPTRRCPAADSIPDSMKLRPVEADSLGNVASDFGLLADEVLGSFQIVGWRA